jgi:hypothetical protein
MRRARLVSSTLLVLVLALGLAACGGGTGGEAREAPETVTVTAPTETEAPPTTSEVAPTITEPDPALLEERAAADICLREVGPILRRLEALEGQLAVSITYQEYRRMLGRVSSAHSGVNVRALDLPCLSRAAVPAEKALNDYIKAENTWSNCIDDFDCDIDSIDPRLQRNWAAATRRTSRASGYLEEVEILLAS